MEQVNMLIIDRSESFCSHMKSILSKNTQMLQVHTATDITEGVHLLTRHPITIVLLDIMLQEREYQTGLYSVLSKKVLPVIILAEPTVHQMAKTVTAMSNGAVDFIRKVEFTNEEAANQFERELMDKLVNVNNANRHRSIARKIKENPLKGEEEIENNPPIQLEKHTPSDVMEKDIIVVIGTSTGGPRALHQVIQQLPKGFEYPIFIVQHMPAGFTKSLAMRLNNIGNIHVKEAVQGEKAVKGTAYIAPGNFHMQVIKKHGHLTLELSQDHTHLPHRPSVDLLFESVARLEEYHKVAVVLTGMGRDGTKGVIEIKTREKEAVIIAESKDTAVIDGMPKAVIETNLVTQIFRIQKIGSAILEYTKRRGN